MSAGTLAALEVTIGVPLAALRAGLSQARGMVAGTAASIAKSLRLAMAVAGGNILAGGIAGLADKMRDLVAEGVAFNAQMETMEIGFAQMLQSADKARQLVADIKKFAKETPFDIAGVSNLASQLLTTRQIAADQLIPTMRKIGDAAAGSAKGFDSLPGISLAITQMLMKGKIAAEEMSRQLVNAGIPAWDILAQKTGKTTKELMELAKQGKLGLNAVLMLIDGMGERFEGLMEKQSRSFSGLWERFRDSARQALGEITGPLFNRLKRMLEKINKFMDSAVFKRIVAGLRSIMESVLSFIERSIVVVANGVSEAISQVKFYMENWRLAFDYIVARAKYVASYLYDQFAYTIDVRLPYGISAMWDGMIAGGKEFINQFQKMVENVVNFMADSMTAVFEMWKRRAKAVMLAYEAWKSGAKPSVVMEVLAAGEGSAQRALIGGMKDATTKFVGAQGQAFGAIGAKISEAVRGALTGMPGFKPSNRTNELGLDEAIAGDNVESAHRNFKGRENARQKIRSAIDFMTSGITKGIESIRRMMGGGGPLGIGPLLEDEEAKERRAEVVSLSDMNRRIQESLTGGEAKERKEILKAAKDNVKEAKEGNVIGHKIADGVTMMVGAIKNFNLGFGQ